MRIIYFDLDCLRPDHLGCYGYNRPTSPNIDRVAAEGVRFTNYYCTSSPCLPSRSGLYSGRYGIRTGTLSNHGAGAQFHIEKELYCGPKPENEIFPRQLRRHGLDTYCFSTFADRHNVWWWGAGWTEFHTPNLKGGLDTGEEINAKVLPWLEKNADKDNYFLHINYWDAHRVYSKDPSWADPLKDYPVAQPWPDEAAIAEHQSVTGLFTAATQPYGDHVKKDKKDFNKSPHPLMADTVACRADFEKMVTGYDAMIRYADYHLGQVLDLLQKQGLLEDSVIIVSADHGDSFGEHAVYTDHVNADNCIHNIPLIVRWPGVTRPGSVDEHFMTNVDFAPTLCDMLNIPAVEQWDGKSYRNNLENRELPADRDSVVWDTALYTVQRAVRTKKHLYMRTYDPGDYNNLEEEELYDMTQDRCQTTNIAGQNPDVVVECRSIMADWVAEQRAKPGFVSDPLAEVLKERGKPVPAELL